MAHCQWRETAPVDSVWGAQEKRPVKCLHPQPQLFVRTHSETRYEDRRKERQITKLCIVWTHPSFNGPFKMRLQFSKHSHNFQLIVTIGGILKSLLYRPNLSITNPYFHKINQVDLNIIPEPHLHVKISVFSTKELWVNKQNYEGIWPFKNSWLSNVEEN